MKPSLIALFLLLVLAAPTAAQDDLDRRTREIAGDMKCPVCENLSAADSPSELAGEMRTIIRQKLTAGESREQIEAYFVDRYGEEVLLRPTRSGFGLLVWLAPPLIIGGGAALIFVATRRWVRAPESGLPEPSDDDIKRYESVVTEQLRGSRS